MSDELAELRQQVAALTRTVEQLQGRVDALTAEVELDEETLMAISAAVAAFLGNRAKVRQVRFHTGRAWAQAGRATNQRRTVAHVR